MSQVQIYFSPSANPLTFFRTDWHTPEQIPSDAFEISEEKHQELVDGMAQGLVLAASNGGLPMLKEPEVLPAPVPTDISAAQGLTYLHRKGFLPAVKAWVYADDTDLEVVIAFEREVRWKRNSTLIEAARAKFGWDDETVDVMFTEAATI